MSRRTARRASTASPSCRSCASTRSTRGLPGDDADEQARFIEGVFSTDKGALRVASLYLPNGNPIDDARNSPTSWPGWSGWSAGPASGWRWRSRWCSPATTTSSPSRSTRRFPENWVNDALFQPETRQAFRRLDNLGFTDAVRAVTDAPRRLHVLGLPGRRLAEEQRHPHRPPDAVAGSRRPAALRRRSKNMSAPGKSRPTTCRWRSSSVSTILAAI